MSKERKPSGYWNKNRCAEEASKYKSRKDFQRQCSGAYQSANKNGWLDEIIPLSNKAINAKKSGYWTKERCRVEALKFELKSEFRHNSQKAHDAAYKNGWLDEICDHMKIVYHNWTFEDIKLEASKFTLRSEFKKQSKKAYQAAVKRGWIAEVCSHMKYSGVKGTMHCAYVILSEKSNSAYVGITRQSFKNRINLHKSNNNTSRSRLIIGNDDVKFIQLTDYIYSEEDVSNGSVEENIANNYRDMGFNILNRESNYGCIGLSETKWTKENCALEALKFKTRKSFGMKAAGAYGASIRNGWLDEVCSHMPKRASRIWTKNKCAELALKFTSKKEFKAKCAGAYSAALKFGILDDICSHMTKYKKQNGYWTKERCYREAVGCKNRNAFKKKSYAYVISLKNGWLDDIFPKHKLAGDKEGRKTNITTDVNGSSCEPLLLR